MIRKLGTSLALAAALLAATALRPAAAEPITLQWQSNNLTEKQYEPVWRKIIAEFEAANPDIKIEPLLVARKDAWTKFVTAAEARQAPCIISVTERLTAADLGYIRPIDAFWNAEPEAWRNAWSPEQLKGVTWKGELFGLPVWGGIYSDIYNVDMVKAAGLDPAKPPATFAEYLDWAKKLTKNGQWATAILGGPTDTTARVLLTWIYSNGGEPFNADMTEATFAKNPKSLEAIKFYLGLAREGLAAPGGTTTNYLEQTNLFAQGKIADMRTAYWAVAKVIGDNPAMKGKMFVAANPAGPGGKSATIATMDATSISTDCKHPEAAWKFIKFEAEPKWAIERARVANWVPLRADMIDDPAIKADPVLAKFLEIGKTAHPYPPFHPAWGDIAVKDVVEAVQRSLLDPAKTEQAFRDLDERATRKLKEH